MYEMLDRTAQRIRDDQQQSSGKTRSEIVREARRRHLAVQTFEYARCQMMPYAEAQGWLTDDDVYREVS